MKTVNRKVTYQLQLSRTERLRLDEMHGLHCYLYNAALEHRRYAYVQRGVSLTFKDQCRDLTQLRQSDPQYGGVNAQSLQVTLKRLDLAFQHFFRRVKLGETPGFPRFKSKDRFSGFGYKTHGDGWKFIPGAEGKHGALRLSSVGWVSLRGCPRKNPMTGKRDLGIPKTMELTKRNGRWQASITFQKELPVRLKGQEVMAFDWGVSTYLSGVNQGFKPSSIEHPHFIRKSLLQIKQLGKKLSKQNRGSSGWRRTRAQISKVYQKLHDQRQNFTHQLSSELISNSQVIITEELGIKSMLEDHHLAQSKGLHRSIADSAVSGLLDKIRYKAEEAGVVFEEVPTRTLKPTQRCARCWKVTKKPLSQRVHDCSHCHFKVDRDYNAALVMMFYYYQKQGQELALWVEKLNRVLMKPETPPITRRV